MKYQLLLAAAVVGLPTFASAQIVNPNPGVVDSGFRLKFEDRGNNTSVRERARPDYDPVGIRIGSFMLRPTLDVEVFNTDNVLRDDTNQEEATGTILRPKFRLNSNWSNHSLEVYGGLSRTDVPDYDSESVGEVEFGASSRLDIQRGSNIQAAVRYFAGREARGSIGTVADTVEPIEYDELTGTLAGIWEVNRVRASARVDMSRLNYEDGLLQSGGVANQDDRDRTTNSFTLRSDYALSPSFALFAQYSWDTRDYKAVSAPFVSRNSKGETGLAGANFDIGDLARGEIGIGYVKQNYEAPVYGDTDGFGYRAAVEWFPSPRLTVAATASRSVEDSAVAGSGGALNSGMGLQFDYELRRNIILTAKSTSVEAEYTGFGRTDRRVTHSLTGAYLLNRNAALSASAVKSDLYSSGPRSGPEYAEWRFWLRLALRM